MKLSGVAIAVAVAVEHPMVAVSVQVTAVKAFVAIAVHVAIQESAVDVAIQVAIANSRVAIAVDIAVACTPVEVAIAIAVEGACVEVAVAVAVEGACVEVAVAIAVDKSDVAVAIAIALAHTCMPCTWSNTGILAAAATSSMHKSCTGHSQPHASAETPWAAAQLASMLVQRRSVPAVEPCQSQVVINNSYSAAGMSRCNNRL